MDKLINFLYNENLIFLWRIIISLICGFIIGFERENMNKNAGIRTHAIVALGASLCMIISQYGFKDHLNYDASRIAAQVVSGIGFLGAGIIFVRGDRDISGLTTAAGIWTTAIIAMAIGSGMILLGIICTILILTIQWFVSKIKNKFHNTGKQNLSLTTDSQNFELELLIHFLEKSNIEIIYLETEKLSDNKLQIQLILDIPNTLTKWQLNDMLLKFNGIVTVKI